VGFGGAGLYRWEAARRPVSGGTRLRSGQHRAELIELELHVGEVRFASAKGVQAYSARRVLVRREREARRFSLVVHGLPNEEVVFTDPDVERVRELFERAGIDVVEHAPANS
jgi:hypothetical protein